MSEYVHGTGASEQRRLELMNELLNGPELERLALSGGERVLEVGAGTGIFARALARAVGPRGVVIGIERSPEQLAQAERYGRESQDGAAGALELRLGDAYEPPLAAAEQGTFDVVHARFLLEHLSDPPRAVAAMVRAARPGGRIVLADDEHTLLRVWPEPPGLYELWDAYQQVYARRGCDPRIGKRLVALLFDAGARPRAATWIFFGGCAGDPHFPLVVDNMAGILDGAREAIAVTAGFDPERQDAAIAAFRAWGRREDAAFWFALSWAEGVKPGRP